MTRLLIYFLFFIFLALITSCASPKADYPFYVLDPGNEKLIHPNDENLDVPLKACEPDASGYRCVVMPVEQALLYIQEMISLSERLKRCEELQNRY